MTQQLFDEVIGEKPPSTVDVGLIVRKEKRAAATRRFAGITAGVMAFAAVATVGVSLRQPSWQADPRRAQPGIAATSEGVKFQLVYSTAESADATAKRLTDELVAAVRQAAPSATWLTPANVRYTEKEPDLDGTLFYGGGNVQFDGREGSLSMQVLPEGRKMLEVLPDGRKMPVCADFATTCESLVVDGVKMVFASRRATDGTTFAYSSEITLADGRQFYLQHMTMLMPAKPGGQIQPPAQKDIALTRDQVIAISAQIASKVIR
jgi:hypothetical protein